MNHADETLTGITTRAIHMSASDRRGGPAHVELFPAGTEVYVTRIRGERCTVRVPGSLYRQSVSLSSIEPA